MPLFGHSARGGLVGHLCRVGLRRPSGCLLATPSAACGGSATDHPAETIESTQANRWAGNRGVVLRWRRVYLRKTHPFILNDGRRRSSSLRNAIVAEHLFLSLVE